MLARTKSLVGISGSLSQPSRTAALVRLIVERFGAEATMIDLAMHGREIFDTAPKGARSAAAAALIGTVETADLLVVGSPVYRASYTGALKHLFDLVDYRALRGTPVIMCATGGTALHGLMPEHQLRPLFGFFGAVTIPTFVYALETDFDGYTLKNRDVLDRVERAVEEGRRQLGISAPTPAVGSGRFAVPA